MRNQKLEDAIRAAGGQSHVARQLFVTPQAVQQWLDGRVPAERVIALEGVCGMSRTAIRPDLYPSEAA